MTNHFPEAFKRFPVRIKRAKSFKDVLTMFHDWGKGRAPMTDAQNKALALEVRNRNKIKTTNIYVEDRNKKGVTRKYWKDALTGMQVQNENYNLNLPAWRDKDIVKEKGKIRNVSTGEILIIRNDKGRYLKRKDWKLVSKKGETKYLHPELRKSKSGKASRKSEKKSN